MINERAPTTRSINCNRWLPKCMPSVTIKRLFCSNEAQVNWTESLLKFSKVNIKVFSVQVQPSTADTDIKPVPPPANEEPNRWASSGCCCRWQANGLSGGLSSGWSNGWSSGMSSWQPTCGCRCLTAGSDNDNDNDTQRCQPANYEPHLVAVRKSVCKITQYNC